MAKTKQTRWVCPECGGGKLAPSRPRKNDVRRYCLPCSESTGSLVERIAPALEKKREAGKAKSQAKLARKREAERMKDILVRHDCAGRKVEINVPKEVRRFRKLGVGLNESVWISEDIDITIRRGQKTHDTGRAWGHTRVAFTFGVDFMGASDAESAIELIAHEVAHLVAPNGEHHGPSFRRILRQMMQAAYPSLPPGSFKGIDGHRYDMDDSIRKGLRDLSRQSDAPVIGKLVRENAVA